MGSSSARSPINGALGGVGGGPARGGVGHVRSRSNGPVLELGDRAPPGGLGLGSSPITSPLPYSLGSNNAPPSGGALEGVGRRPPIASGDSRVLDSEGEPLDCRLEGNLRLIKSFCHPPSSLGPSPSSSGGGARTSSFPIVGPMAPVTGDGSLQPWIDVPWIDACLIRIRCPPVIRFLFQRAACFT